MYNNNANTNNIGSGRGATPRSRVPTVATTATGARRPPGGVTDPLRTTPRKAPITATAASGTPSLPSLTQPRASLRGSVPAPPPDDGIPTYASLYDEHGGASMVSSGGAGGRGGGGVVVGPRGRPSATSRELQRHYTGPARTAKGRAIQRDLDDLAEDYFGDVSSVVPPASRGPAMGEDAADSQYAKFTTVYTEEAVPRSWRKGPADTAGRVFDASDRNLLCMDVLPPGATAGARGGRGRAGGASNPLCVVGSADHGLKVFDMVKMTEKKNLYTKACGHTEWVTTCKFLPNGQVLSGGMDSKLCLWESVLSGPVRCQDLLGHTGSISQVDVNEHGIAVSASYDRTLRIWDVNGYGREVGCLAGHKGPVMQFAWAGSQILSGDRQGSAKVWDITTATCVATMATKRGQIGALAHTLHSEVGHLTMFGDQGGVLTVLDLRQGKRPVYQAEVHPGGVLSGICSIDYKPYVVTCGADRRIAVLDPRRNFEETLVFTDHDDFIYSMKTFGPLVLSGAGNGWLLVHDTTTGECCYGLGANKAAVREIFATPDFLVAAGDDGKASVYDYNSLFM